MLLNDSSTTAPQGFLDFGQDFLSVIKEEFSPQQLKRQRIDDRRVIYGVDYGTCKWHVQESQGEIKRDKEHSMKTKEFIELDFAVDNSVLVIESTHAVPRKPGGRQSKAHPLTIEQAITLRDNAKARGIEIRLFSNVESGRWRLTYALEDVDYSKKTDYVDAKTIARAAEEVGYKSLQKYKPESYNNYSRKQQRFFDLIQRTNDIAINLRGVDYLIELLDEDQGVQMLHMFKNKSAIIESKLEDAVRRGEPGAVDALKLIFHASEGRFKFDAAHRVAIGIWVTLCDEDCKIRLNPHGCPYGVNTLLRFAFNQKSAHRKGGVVRSDLMALFKKTLDSNSHECKESLAGRLPSWTDLTKSDDELKDEKIKVLRRGEQHPESAIKAHWQARFRKALKVLLVVYRDVLESHRTKAGKPILALQGVAHSSEPLLRPTQDVSSDCPF